MSAGSPVFRFPHPKRIKKEVSDFKKGGGSLQIVKTNRLLFGTVAAGTEGSLAAKRKERAISGEKCPSFVFPVDFLKKICYTVPDINRRSSYEPVISEIRC